jgi:CPA2 family monovalent cation:H+ antiporter-2
VEGERVDFSAIMRDLSVVLAIATVVALVFVKMRLSPVAAFLVAGVILGPTGAGLVSEPDVVSAMAEIGVALFLFTVAIETPPSSLGRFRRQVLWAGSIQVAMTLVIAAAATALAGFGLPIAIFTGFILSVSSTSIVLKVYADRGEADSTQGRLSAGILLLQDIAVVPMMLLTPILREWTSASPAAVALTMGKAALAVGGVLLLARVVIPLLMREVIRLNSREVLGLTILLVCLGTAWLAHRFGLSIAMGAFLAGLAVSESEYVHAISAQVLPFSDVFIGVSYIAVGMLIDVRFLGWNWPLVAGMAAGVALLKFITVAAAIRWVGYSWRVTCVTAIGLVQVGEFGFLLIADGFRTGLIGPEPYQFLLSVTILMMIATPFLIHGAPWAVRLLGFFPGMGGGGETPSEAPEQKMPVRENHVIIAGYGVNGKNLARVLKSTRVPYVIADMNEWKVGEARAAGEPIVFGDVHSPQMLERLGAARARVLVVAISDPMATRRVVGIARTSNPGLFILVRTRYLADLDDLLALGADAVIPEEFETSVEIFSRVLAEYQVPDHVIRQQEQLIRSGAYRILRERAAPGGNEVLAEFEAFLARKVIELFYVSEASGWKGREVRELPAGGDTGIVLLAILRDDRAVVQPNPSMHLEEGDKIVLFGGHAPLAAALEALSGRGRGAAG